MKLKSVGTFTVSSLWSLSTRLMRLLIQQGVLRPVVLSSRVISVGNIQAGGAGKTPLVAQIAREAHERGMVVCILSRGYQSVWESEGGVLTPGNELIVPTRLCGDEAALLHQLCPFAWIGIGADRVSQFEKIKKHTPSKIDLVLLDDGFQSWKIKKDLEIVAWTSAQPWQIPFRESQKSLEQADLVVWTKGSEPPSRAGMFKAPLVKVQYEIGSPTLPSPSPSEPLWLVTGIADGKSAYDLMKKKGFPIVEFTAFEDHFSYTHSQVHKILEKADCLGWRVALTGKDWVKWAELGVLPSQVIVIEPRLHFESGKKDWNRLLWGELDS